MLFNILMIPPLVEVIGSQFFVVSLYSVGDD